MFINEYKTVKSRYHKHLTAFHIGQQLACSAYLVERDTAQAGHAPRPHDT